MSHCLKLNHLPSMFIAHIISNNKFALMTTIDKCTLEFYKSTTIITRVLSSRCFLKLGLESKPSISEFISCSDFLERFSKIYLKIGLKMRYQVFCLLQMHVYNHQ